MSLTKCERELKLQLEKVLGIKNRSYQVDEAFSYVLREGEYLQSVIVESEDSITFNIGTSAFGTQIYTDLITDGYEVITVDQFANGGPVTLYFSGYDPLSVKIHLFIQKAKLYI